MTPVVSVARLVAVVDGKEVCTFPSDASESRLGAYVAYVPSTSAPNPSIRKRSSRPLGLSPTFIESDAVAKPRLEKIEGMICDRCTALWSHEYCCHYEFIRNIT
jgi:hypothetical protein